MRKILLPLCCAAFGLCAGPKALWLVYPEPLKEGVDKERYLRSEFEVPQKEIKQAFIGYIIDDYGTVLLNGQNVANAPLPRTEVPKAKQYDITKLLVPGRNVFAVTAVNAGGPGGFILHISITFQDDSELELFTDTDTWKISKVKPMDGTRLVSSPLTTGRHRIHLEIALCIHGRTESTCFPSTPTRTKL